MINNGNAVAHPIIRKTDIGGERSSYRNVEALSQVKPPWRATAQFAQFTHHNAAFGCNQIVARASRPCPHRRDAGATEYFVGREDNAGY